MANNLMAIRTLPATEVKNRFGRVLREVSKTGGPIFVERDGRPVAVILSLREYMRRRERPTLTRDRYQLLRSAFGMWANRSDISDDWLTDSRTQWTSVWNNGESE